MSCNITHNIIPSVIHVFIIFFCTVDTVPDKEFCKNVSAFVGPRLTNLANIINEHNKKSLPA